MDIFTLYVGQGDLTAVRAGNEAIIIDAHMPDCDSIAEEQIQDSLTSYLAKVNVRGLILTGLDRDHACPAGVEFILSSFRPAWIMYPKYYKDTDSASEVFATIARHEARRSNTLNPLIRKSVRVDRLDSRTFSGLASYFSFELFSPHMEDMNSSNNSSIVLKLTGLDQTGFSYLITGDTEMERWERINKIFGPYLSSDVLSAAHHGAHSGVHPHTLLLVDPDTVLISAGVDNCYGHPHGNAVTAYRLVSHQVYSTNATADGTCLFTRRTLQGFETRLVRHPERMATV